VHPQDDVIINQGLGVLVLTKGGFSFYPKPHETASQAFWILKMVKKWNTFTFAWRNCLYHWVVRLVVTGGQLDSKTEKVTLPSPGLGK